MAVSLTARFSGTTRFQCFSPTSLWEQGNPLIITKISFLTGDVYALWPFTSRQCSCRRHNVISSGRKKELGGRGEQGGGQTR